MNSIMWRVDRQAFLNMRLPGSYEYLVWLAGGGERWAVGRGAWRRYLGPKTKPAWSRFPQAAVAGGRFQPCFSPTSSAETGQDDGLPGPYRAFRALRMPRYFFNTRIGDDLIPDSEGAELRDPDHAWEVARTMIRELLRDQSGLPNLAAAALEVTDAQGEVVLEFPFSEALIAPPDDPPTTH